MGRNTFYVNSYAKAEEIFNKRGPVRSTQWSIDQRPLDPRPDTSRRLIQVQTPDADYYDVRLYNTVMARFYKPTVEDGQRVERRLYMGHPSITSQSFMWKALGVSTRMMYSNDEILQQREDSTMVPVYSRHFMMDNDTMFSLDATFVNGKLDITRSSHTPHHRVVADKADKERKAALIKHFDNYIMLAQMRLPEFEASAKMDVRSGRPWGGEGYHHQHAHAVECIHTGSETQREIDHFFEMCQSAYNSLASKRGYDQGIVKHTYWLKQKPADPTPDDLAKPITADEFRRSIIDRITKYARVETKSSREEVAQFPLRGKYPKSNLWT